MPTCQSCGSANAEGARFCSSCGSALADDSTGTGERRQMVSIVFCDLAGSTDMGERLDPESLRRVMLRYYAEMRFALERHGGTVEKFIGDAVMAVFGIPSMREDDALRAVRAALDMKEALERLNDELEQRWGVRLHTRTGVNTGKVVAGNPSRGEGFVVGDAVNVAARLEQAAPRDEILIGEDTHGLVRGSVSVESVEPLALKGKSEPVPAFRLLEASKQGPTRRLDSAIVGREAELLELTLAFERAESERRCELFTVVGAPGVGKSRLALEFLSSLSGRSRVLRGRCLSYGEGITFWPVAEVVREAAGVQDGDTADSAQAAISALFAEPDDATVMPLVGVLGLAEESYSSEETFLAMRVLLQTLAHERPLTVVFDDIHWGEETFLDLIEFLADTSRDAPLFVCCLARPELRSARPSLAGQAERRATRTLEPLPAEQSQKLIENLLGRGRLAEQLSGRIADAAQGNPLFVEEMLRMLVDQGRLSRQNGSWAVEGDIAEIGVPPTIEALLAARLDRLSPEERGVIERAAVIGKEFWPAALAALSPNSEPAALAIHLDALIERDLIQTGGPLFAGERALQFGHILIRDVAYSGLLKESRSVLHERFADWLEQQIPTRSEHEEILGYHLEQAFRYQQDLGPLDEAAHVIARRAFAYLSAAGTHAHARGDMTASAKLLQRSIGLLPDGDPAVLRLKLNLGQALFHAGDYARAGELFAETASGAETAGDRALALHAELERADVESYADHAVGLASLRDAAERAIPIFEELSDEAGLARSWRALSICDSDECRWGAAVEELERALAHATRAGDRELYVQIASGLGFALFLSPVPVTQALARMPVLGELVIEGHAPGQAARLVAGAGEQALMDAVGTAGLKAMAGRLDEAREIICSAKEILRELGQERRIVEIECVHGRIEMLAEDLDAAEREFRSAYRALAEMHDVSVLPTVAAELAEVMYSREAYEEAERLALGSRDSTASSDIESQIRWRAILAKVLARQGRHAEADELASEAVAQASAVEFPLLEGAAELALAEVRRLAGRLDDAATAASRALALHEAKENVVSARTARTLLDELQASAA